jgi:hypothetical protein
VEEQNHGEKGTPEFVVSPGSNLVAPGVLEDRSVEVLNDPLNIL